MYYTWVKNIFLRFSTSGFLIHNNIDTYAENVTTCLTELAKKISRSKQNNNLKATRSTLADYIYKNTNKKNKTTLQ